MPKDSKTVDKPKVCVNCRHYIAPPEGQTWAYAKCRAPENDRSRTALRALVTGEPIPADFQPNWMYCDSARGDFGPSESSCGAEARWYKPREGV
jgi:hypothetical protein